MLTDKQFERIFFHFFFVHFDLFFKVKKLPKLARRGDPPALIDFDMFSKVKKLPQLRAGGGGKGNLGNAQTKMCFFMPYLLPVAPTLALPYYCNRSLKGIRIYWKVKLVL